MTPSRKSSRRARGAQAAGGSSPAVATPVTPLDHVSARGGGGGGAHAQEEGVSSDGECASEVVGDSDTATTTTTAMHQHQCQRRVRSTPRVSTDGLIPSSSMSKQPVMVRVESANYSVINADGSDNEMEMDA